LHIELQGFMLRHLVMKRLGYAAGVVLVAIAALMLLAPAFIDTPAVRAEIQRRLSAALHGQVAWESLEIAFFPAPRGELRKLRLEIPQHLDATADELNVYLRLWPLLRGSPEISSVSLLRPRVRITPGEGGSDAPLDALALYRNALEPALGALQDFAPDMKLKMDEATVELGDGFTLRGLRAAASTDREGIDAELTAASNFWQRLSVKARVEYADLSARATVALDDLMVDKDLPPASLRAKLHTDGKSAIDGEFDGNLGTLVPAAKGRVHLPAGKPPQLAAELGNVELAQALSLARLKGVPLDVIESAEGRISLKIDASLDRASIDVLRSDAAVKLAALPWKLSAHAAHVTVTEKQLRVANARGSVGESTFEKAAALVDFGKNARLSAASGSATLKLEQWFPWLKDKLPLDEIETVSGTADVTLHRLALGFDNPAAADFEALVTPRNAAASLKALPGALSIAGGAIRADRKRVRVSGLQGALGSSTFADAAAEIELRKPARIVSASGRATLDLAQWHGWLQARLPVDELTSASGAAELTLNRLALRFDDPAAASYDAMVAPRKATAVLKALPAPVSIDRGSVRVAPREIVLEHVALGMLDARAEVSGTFSPASQAVALALANGMAGENVVRWALERAEVPARLEPRTPLRFAARRIAWAPKGALEADARVEFDGGPGVSIVMAQRPGAVELPRIAIKDERSDAALSATVGEKRIEAGFSGTLHGATIAAMLKSAPSDSGRARGKWRITVDRAQPENSIAEGNLEIEALDLTWLAGRKVLIQRVGLSAKPDGLRVADARFAVDDQPLELHGEGRRTPQGPVVEARIESPGVDVLRLLPPPDKNAPRKKSAAIWPLPVSGRIQVNTGFAKYKDYRIEPFAGVLTLEPRRARLEVKEARMCGVSFPMEIETAPDMNSAAVHVAMKDQPLERTVRCLTGGDVELTGNADLTAELRTQGQRPHLLRDMTGTAQAEVRDGRVKKFALIGNILAFRGIASLEDMKSDGFPYRRMSAKGHFAGGQFRLEEGFFDSNAARLAASGHIDLLGANSQLSVLVAPLSSVERIVGAVPLLGDVFGGTMVALPVSVIGDIRNPVIVPLGPRAISNQLLGIFERTLKLPGKLVVPPDAKQP
jgi:hypothetical protein